jgi:hypothetical protein
VQHQQQMLILEHRSLPPRRLPEPVAENVGDIPRGGKKRFSLHSDASDNERRGRFRYKCTFERL